MCLLSVMEHVAFSYVKHGVRRRANKSVVDRQPYSIARRKGCVYYFVVMLVHKAQKVKKSVCGGLGILSFAEKIELRTLYTRGKGILVLIVAKDSNPILPLFIYVIYRFMQFTVKNYER